MRRALDAALRWSPAQPLFRWRASRHLAVLAYHAIDDPDRFEAQLEHLRRAMHPVSLEEVRAATAEGAGLPRRAALITFDDGDRTVLDLAAPLMAEKGLPGVAFVVTSLLGTDRTLWTQEVVALARGGGRTGRFGGLSPEDLVVALKRTPEADRLSVIEELRRTASEPSPRRPQLRPEDLRALEGSGITIGSHSATHRPLPTCTDDGVRTEIVDAHGSILAATGHHPRAFAYPDGHWDPRAASVLAELDYAVAFLFDHRSIRLPPSDRYRLSRLRVSSTDSLDRFRVVLSGLHPALLAARTRVLRRPTPGAEAVKVS